MNAIKYKTFFEPNVLEDSPIYEAQQVIKSLIASLEKPEGWSKDVCVHTDYWENQDQSIGTMCFLTQMKHIHCTNDDLKTIEKALKTIMDYKTSQNENPRNISNFNVYPFLQTMKTATVEFMIKHTEIEKAEIAIKNKALVTFNDLCLETFRANSSYTDFSNGISELSLAIVKSVNTLTNV